MARSVYPVLETAVGFSQQLRCHGQVTLRRVQIDMSKIGGQGRQKKLHVRTSPIPFRQPVDGERVPQVMKPRLTRVRVAASNSRKDAQAAEVGVYSRVAEALMLPRLEKGPVMLVPSSRRGQILSEDLDHIGSQRNKSGLVELCPVDGDHAPVEIHLSHTQPQRFTHSHTRSVEEQQQGAKRSCGGSAANTN